MPCPAMRLLVLLVAVAMQVAGGGRAGGQDGAPVTSTDDLSAIVDHPLVPLASVATKVFEGTEVDETGQRIATRLEETVLSQPIHVAGIEVTVVEVDDYHDGTLHDVTTEYFAQGPDSTVYYVGERVDESANGTIVNHDGTWLSGEQGAQPGVFMPADPEIGETFSPENLPDVAIEQATVIALDQAITTVAGAFEGCLVTKEVDLPLGSTERKTYCPGVGLVREDWYGGSVELVAFGTTTPADARRAATVVS